MCEITKEKIKKRILDYAPSAELVLWIHYPGLFWANYVYYKNWDRFYCAAFDAIIEPLNVAELFEYDREYEWVLTCTDYHTVFNKELFKQLQAAITLKHL